jgi:hypothetical protein
MTDSTTAPTVIETRWHAEASVERGRWIVVESGVTPGGVPYSRQVAECRGENAERNARIMAGARTANDAFNTIIGELLTPLAETATTNWFLRERLFRAIEAARNAKGA